MTKEKKQIKQTEPLSSYVRGLDGFVIAISANQYNMFDFPVIFNLGYLLLYNTMTFKVQDSRCLNDAVIHNTYIHNKTQSTFCIQP